jgi:hypothetical protein
MINNSTDICNANKSLKKNPDPLHMALELQVLVWDRYKPYVMEFTKTLVINVVPTSYNSKCRENKTCLPLVCVPNMMFYIWITDILFADLYTSYSKHVTVGIVAVTVLIICASVTVSIYRKCK